VTRAPRGLLEVCFSRLRAIGAFCCKWRLRGAFYAFGPATLGNRRLLHESAPWGVVPSLMGMMGSVLSGCSAPLDHSARNLGLLRAFAPFGPHPRESCGAVPPLRLLVEGWSVPFLLAPCESLNQWRKCGAGACTHKHSCHVRAHAAVGFCCFQQSCNAFVVWSLLVQLGDGCASIGTVHYHSFGDFDVGMACRIYIAGGVALSYVLTSCIVPSHV